MPRRPRIEYPGAFYHVLARGNNRKRIFIIDADYDKYLTLVKKYKKMYGFHLYAYALMPNHVHLLVESAEMPLSKIMQGLQQSYTQYFNLRHEAVGHVFQGRYKALICEKDAYLLELVRYIHLNPVRAQISSIPSEYRWTSHQYYLRRSQQELVNVDFVLAQFASDRRRALESYQQFIQDGIQKDYRHFLDQVIDQRIFGSCDFVEEILQKEEQSLEGLPLVEKPALTNILNAVAEVVGVSSETIQSNSKSRDHVHARRLFCYIARMYYNYQLREIAEFINNCITAVSKNVQLSVNNSHYKGKLSKDLAKVLCILGQADKCIEFQA
jgi:putative transposase